MLDKLERTVKKKKNGLRPGIGCKPRSYCPRKMISIISTRQPVSIVKYQSVIARTFIVTLRLNDRWKERKRGGREEKEQRNLFYKCRVLHCGH